MPHLQLRHLFRHLDKNGNGHIDLREFISFCTHHSASGSAASATGHISMQATTVHAPDGAINFAAKAAPLPRRVARKHRRKAAAKADVSAVKHPSSASSHDATRRVGCMHFAPRHSVKHRTFETLAQDRGDAMRRPMDAVKAARAACLRGGTATQAQHPQISKKAYTKVQQAAKQRTREQSRSPDGRARARAQAAGLLMHPFQGGGQRRRGLQQRFDGPGSLHYEHGGGRELGGPWSVSGTDTATTPMYSSFARPAASLREQAKDAKLRRLRQQSYGKGAAMSATSAPGYAARHARSRATGRAPVDRAPLVNNEPVRDAPSVGSNQIESPAKLVVVSLALDDNETSTADTALCTEATSGSEGATEASDPKKTKGRNKTEHKRKYKARRKRAGAPPPTAALADGQPPPTASTVQPQYRYRYTSTYRHVPYMYKGTSTEHFTVTTDRFQ